MPEHLQSLPIILALASAVFLLAQAPLTAQACSVEDFRRRRNLWFVFTLAAFLAHNFWLFILVIGLVLVVAAKAERNALALYLGLAVALPDIGASIPGLGVFNELFEISPVRLLALLVLLPAFLSLRTQAGVAPFGQLLCDKLLFGYLALEFVLTVPHRTLTSVLRDSVFYAFVDVFLPYYVASRALRTVKDFRDVFAAFIVSVGVLSLFLMFEFLRTRLLYSALAPVLGVYDYGWTTYLARGSRMRAIGTAGHPIAAGYLCAVAFGFYLYLRTLVPKGAVRTLAMLLLVGGLIGALSRAPWVGAVLITVVFLALGPAPGRSLMKLGLAVLLSLPFLLLTPYGRNIIDLLPWVGTVDAENVAGRERLAEVSFRVMMENPLFGRFDVMEHPDIESLRGGHGIIDTVNTYVVVGLRAGFVGLALFTGFFATAVGLLFRGMRRTAGPGDERHLLGRALLATLLGVLFMIGTTSPVLAIPTIYWCMGGLAIAYARLVEQGATPVADALGRPGGRAVAAGPVRSGSRRRPGPI